MILFRGKERDLTFKELWMIWNFGRLIEQFEAVGFSVN